MGARVLNFMRIFLSRYGSLSNTPTRYTLISRRSCLKGTSMMATFVLIISVLDVSTTAVNVSAPPGAPRYSGESLHEVHRPYFDYSRLFTGTRVVQFTVL